LTKREKIKRFLVKRAIGITLLSTAVLVFLLGAMNLIPEEKVKLMFLFVISGTVVLAAVQILEKYYLNVMKAKLQYLKKEEQVYLVTIPEMLGIGVCAIPIQFLFGGVPNIQTAFWWPFLFAVLLNVLIQYWGNKAQFSEDVSIVSSLQGITPAFVILTSFIMLREFPTISGLAGILVIVLGTYILNLRILEKKDASVSEDLNGEYPSKLSHRILLPWKRMLHSRGARLALYTAILGSIALNFDKLAVVSSSPMILAGTKFTAVGIIVYLFAKASGRWDRIRIADRRRFFLPVLGIGIILGFSEVLMNTGYLFGIVPEVGSLKRMQIVWTVMMAGVFLGEKYNLVRTIASLTIVAGVVLIGLQ
jgi:drug/metabolite transporter (DMT)-like permease